MKKIIFFLIAFAFSAVSGASIATAAGLDPVATTGGLMSLSLFIPQGTGVLNAGVQMEIWSKYIIGNLLKNNAFLEYAFNADEFVRLGKIVHIPQAGAAANVARNRQSLPATVKRRKDTDIIYLLDEFTCDPTLIDNADQIELSYSKMDSVMGENMAKLQQEVAEWMLINWAPTVAARIIKTTGGSVAPHIGTGNKKLLLIKDLQKAKTLMNKLNIPASDRYAMVDSEMYDQIVSDATFTTTRDVIRDLDLPSGTINRIHGFNILERSTVLTADNSSTALFKTPEESIISTDRAAALCWHKNSVERAKGTVDFFERLKDPTYYGDIYSFLVNMGGRIRREKEEGVIAIVQDNA
jgi:hypothetical protein